LYFPILNTVIPHTMYYNFPC